LFFFHQEKQIEENQEEDNLGVPTIKYGETIVFIRHVDSDLWISYETLELTIKGIGKVEEKRVREKRKRFLFAQFFSSRLSQLLKAIWMIVFVLYELKNKNRKQH
jgi:hypothetical protein